MKLGLLILPENKDVVHIITSTYRKDPEANLKVSYCLYQGQFDYQNMVLIGNPLKSKSSWLPTEAYNEINK